MNKGKQWLTCLMLLVVVSLNGCSSDGASHSAKPSQLSTMPEANYELLFIGNSHSSANGLPNLVSALITAVEPEKSANTALVPGYRFLDERVNDGVTLETLNARNWTHVFLQAQKYSTSGRYFYSTSAAQDWIRQVKNLGGTPVMFPEWPRYRNKIEGQRIYELHLQIANNEAACVAPIGPVWDEFQLLHPDIKLHGPDGNHSNLNGALLTAYVFFQIVTSKPANVLGYLPQIDVSEDTQQKLKTVALDFHNIHLPCP